MTAGIGRERLAEDLRALGVAPGGVLMVHSSLSALGRVEGGADTVIAALDDALGPDGTLVMPAFRDGLAVVGHVHSVPRALIDRAHEELTPFDPRETPTNCGAIPERFRRLPDVRRSEHPFVSVTARGPRAAEIVAPHPPSWGQGPGSPFERLAGQDAQLLLLGVGFNRLSMLHHAESLVPHGRRKTRLVPDVSGALLLAPDAGDDLGVHFPAVGEALLAEGVATDGPVGAGTAILMRARATVERAAILLGDRLAAADRAAS